MHRGLAGGQYAHAGLEQVARGTLQEQRLEVAVEETGVDHVGFFAQQRGDLGVVLAREELGHLRGLHLHLGEELLDRGLEVGPRILAPGVVLVDPGDRLQIGLDVPHVERRADVVHGRRGRGAEHVLVVAVLEDARGAAVEEVGELLEFLGHRGDRQTVAARHVADHHVHVAALDQVAELGDLRRGRAGLVDDDRFHRLATEPLLAVRAGHLAGVERLDHQFGRVLGRDAEWCGRGARQERDDADLDRLGLRGDGNESGCGQDGRNDAGEMAHDFSFGGLRISAREHRSRRPFVAVRQVRCMVQESTAAGQGKEMRPCII